MTQDFKDWWAPLWRGLVDDPVAKHYRAIGKAVWLLLYCFVHVDRLTGSMVRKQATIARDTGWSVRTIRAWARQLERAGYINIVRTGRAGRIQVARWRPIGKRAAAALVGKRLPTSSAAIEPSGNRESKEGDVPSAELELLDNVNKNSFTKLYLRQAEMRANDAAVTPTGRVREAGMLTELLAQDLAEGLGDREHLSQYRDYASRYPDGVLRQLMSETRSVPSDQIKKSRAALFNYLLKQYEHRTAENPRY